jgi:hypothetical protein
MRFPGPAVIVPMLRSIQPAARVTFFNESTRLITPQGNASDIFR